MGVTTQQVLFVELDLLAVTGTATQPALMTVGLQAGLHRHADGGQPAKLHPGYIDVCWHLSLRSTLPPRRPFGPPTKKGRPTTGRDRLSGNSNHHFRFCPSVRVVRTIALISSISALSCT